MRFWLFGLIFLMGCAGSDTGIYPYVPWDDVPSAVKIAARSQRPDCKFRSAFRMPNGNFQVRARDVHGRGVAVDVTPDGSVLQVRTY